MALNYIWAGFFLVGFIAALGQLLFLGDAEVFRRIIEGTFTSAKVAVMDGALGALSTVGSSNLDPLSLLLAREANIFVRDDAFAAELRSHLVEAIATEGQRIESSAHLKRSLRTRGLSWIAYGLMRIALFATRNRY